MNLIRPYPPEGMEAGVGGMFVPSPDLDEWVKAAFLDDTAPTFNPDHEHLRQAHIGYLWTNEPNEKKQRMVLGTCQLMPPTGDKWSAGRAAVQIGDWFEAMPDFLITLYAPECFTMDDASFMALLEHEMYHCAQKRDQFGDPQFDQRSGAPLWAIRGHDVEQFVGVVRRYGAAASDVSAMVDAANAGPEIAHAAISGACGTCLRLVA